MKISFRSLYLKIFIWFWVAMIIINVVLFAAFALTRPTPTRRSFRDLAQTGPNAQKAAEVYEQSGSAALSATLQAIEKAGGASGSLTKPEQSFPDDQCPRKPGAEREGE